MPVRSPKQGAGMVVAEKLVGKPPKERAEIKASEYAKLETPIEWTTDDRIGIVIERLSLDNKKNLLVVDLVATKDGKEFDRGIPYYYYNPPILTSTGRMIPSGEKDPQGNDILMDETAEDLPACLKIIVGRTVRSRVV